MSYDLAKAEWEKVFATTFLARIRICYSRVWIRVNWRFLVEVKRPLESQRWSTVKDAGKNAEFYFIFSTIRAYWDVLFKSESRQKDFIIEEKVGQKLEF